MLVDDFRNDAVLLVGVILAVTATTSAGAKPATINDLVFLTRDGCVNTATMRSNLDAALAALHWPTNYRVINIDGVSRTDVRGGYPTPTVLWKGADLFGLPTPTPPFPEPS